MNQIPIYQHPFVDVFKTTKLTEWQTAQKEGDVTEIYDKTLAKNVIKVNGVTTASNYFQLPAQKHLPKRSLGLIGKYVYSIINVPPGKTFVLHFDYMVNDTRLVRVSLSNLYKEFKNLNGTSIQVPIIDGLQFNKWTFLCLNAAQVLSDNQVFSPGQKQSFFLRSIQVTANVQIKGIYTSDIKYTVQSLPKEMALKVVKGQDWFQQYAWISYPLDEEGQVISKENISNNKQEFANKKKSNKHVKFSEERKNEEPPVNEDVQIQQQFDNGTHAESNQELEKSEAIERTLKDIEMIKSQYNMDLEEKHLQTRAEFNYYYDQDTTLFPRPQARVSRTLKEEEFFILKPNPIIKLDRSIGFNPKFTSGQVYFNRDAKLSREILYTSANILLGYQHSTQKQRLFYENHSTSIEHLKVQGNFAFTITRDSEQHSYGPNSRPQDFEISIWDIQETKLLFSFKPPLTSLHSITLNEAPLNDSYLCLSGKDFQKRDLILIYSFNELITHKRVEIYARQICDFDLANISFVEGAPNSLVACGRENIRFFKIKNGHLPSQLVTLNNTGRGKTFNLSLSDCSINDKGLKKTNQIFVTTSCGLLYIINYSSRQVDKIIQIHEERITSLIMSPNKQFIASASVNGILRLWSPDFSKLISEVNTQQSILSCDVNHKEIVVMSNEGTISLLDMEESSFNVIIRSHLDNIQDLCCNKPGGKSVSIGFDQKIYIWNSETMEVMTEFSTQNDLPTKLATSSVDPTVAIGFKSGFIRIFDLSFEQSGKLIAETMIFESPVMDIKYSPDNKFFAVFYKSSRIVIFNVEKGYQPVKTIDYEFPNENYFSISFSSDGKYLANISSNANNVTVWETKNFSLKFHLDLTGDIISKIQFAPNGKDLVVLTTSSKMKFYRINLSELLFNKDIYGLTDLECLDFEISPNNKFIACCGKEGVVKIYDYYMRGSAIPSSQGFIGHFKYPKKIFWQPDMRFIYTLGEGNGIFRWSFFGDKEMPADIKKYYEELEPQKTVKQPHSDEPIFNHPDLLKLTHGYQDEQYNLYSNSFDPNDQMGLTRQVDPIQEPVAPSMKIPNLATNIPVQYNQNGYRFEQYDIQLKKVLQCSIGEGIKNNLVWNKERRYIAYTSSNIIIVEDLNQEKTQRLLKEGNDKIYQLKLSPNGKMLLAFTKQGKLDGVPCIYVWDSTTLKKLNQIAINDMEIVAVEFSVHSNMLLVISRSLNDSLPQKENDNDISNVITQVAVWDFLEGHKDILCKSQIPLNIIDCRWNYYLGDSNEFVTISERKYHYWKISNNLTLQYQDGHIPQKKNLFSNKDEKFTTCEFVIPTPEQLSVYMMLGLNSGYIWVSDSRSNQFVYSIKVLDGSIRQIMSSKSKIVMEGSNEAILYCWPQGITAEIDKSDPNSFFFEKVRQLTIDGFPQASSYGDESFNECIISTSSGTLWFISWMEQATIKLKSCHSPHFPLSCCDFKYIPPSQFNVSQQDSDEPFLQFDQNYAIATSGKDGVIKLWNMYDSEFILQFIVPKEECVAIAMHQFKPYMVASFTDGYVRFFEIQSKSKTLGRCQLHNTEDDKSLVDYLVSIKILPSGNHILGSTNNGQVVLIYIQQWEPLAIKIEQLAQINTSIHSFDVSFLEPYNKWLVGTSNGKVIVYNRKDFNAYQQELFDENNPPRFNYMDSFNILDYVDNSFTESKRCNTLDHYYSISKRNVVKNEVDDLNRCDALFSNADLTLYICFIVKAPYLFIRNFELHQVTKRIGLQSLPLQINLTPNSSFYIVLQQDNVIKMVDFINPENTSEIQTIHEEAKCMKICPNGRYVLTGGSKGDVCIWQIRKKEINQQDLMAALE